MKAIAATAILLAAFAGAASAEPCHFTQPSGVICERADDAAVVGALYAPKDLVPDYIGALLQRFNCGRRHTETLTVREHGRIPSGAGWLGVARVEFKTIYGVESWYVADAYLQGDCQVHQAPIETFSMKALSPPPAQ